jgi:SNF2 family DNA or RNA helicase
MAYSYRYNSNTINFCTERLKIIKSSTLDESSPTTTYAPPSLTADLKLHQKTILHAMLKLETEDIRLDNNKSVRAQLGICADSPGSGKSVDILSLICTRPIIPNTPKLEATYGPLVQLSSTPDMLNYIESNLIVVPHQTVRQWKTYIDDFTKLKYIIISKKSDFSSSKVNISPAAGSIILCSSTCYNAFMQSSFCKNKTFSRVVFDEADSINIPACRYVSASFTWFVSSSLQNLLFPSGNCYVPSVVPSLNRYTITKTSIDGIRRSGYIKDCFKALENTEANAVVKKLILKNNDTYIAQSFQIPKVIYKHVLCQTPRFMRFLTDVITTDVLTFLNAGDVQGAIEKLGCPVDTGDNIVSLFCSKLSQQKENTEKTLECTKAYVFTRPQEMDTQNKKIISLENEIKTIEDKIQHIKSRILNNKFCPICLDDITTPALTSCCQNTYCFDCLTRTLSVSDFPTCPMCRQEVTRKDVIVLGVKKEEEVKKRSLPSKLDALLSIVTKSRKCLIFSSHEQSFKHVSAILTDNDIQFAKLSGTAARINNLVTKFKHNESGLDVLLLNASHYGTGLNLENATDVVFFHKMNQNLEVQVIGRAQRANRTSSLCVHHICYENELPMPSSIA